MVYMALLSSLICACTLSTCEICRILDFYDEVLECADNMHDVHNFHTKNGEDVHVPELPSSRRGSIDTLNPWDSCSHTGGCNPPSVAPSTSTGIGSLVTSNDSSLTTIDSGGNPSSNYTSSGYATDNYSSDFTENSILFNLL